MPILNPVTDRDHVRWDGPLSQRIVLVAFGGLGPLAAVGSLIWLIGSNAGKVLLAVSSGLFAVMMFAAFVVERRERRREGEPIK